ncbi:MAG TPA: chemotaxis response regulator protein-glutamate methylesterase [Dermatophilaceae bacterium]|nr:chemotaxis response regulator protein-glutamate methylesterase [Dermatophilaceae bacterium]
MAGARIRVLVCDDSVVIRRLVSEVLSSDPDIEVVGTAVNGKHALDNLERLKPDVMILDVEMPIMDGLQTLIEVRRVDRTLPIIMFSTLTERGAGATLDALERGASDYVTKPSNVASVSESMAAVRSQLIPRIKSLTGRLPRPVRTAGPANPDVFLPQAPASASSRVDIVCIGVSTGGPDALTQLIPRLPTDFPVPLIVTQHMPPVFTQLFAQRLNAKSRLKVSEATDGDAVRAGRVLIAPGDFHMRLVNCANGPVVRLDQGPQENYCRPAVDAMFRSVPTCYQGRALAVIMTGMGSDGVKGAEHIVHAGGSLIVQDEKTSVVWGMPGAAVAAGLPGVVVPLPALADTILSRVQGGRAGSARSPGSSTSRRVAG